MDLDFETESGRPRPIISGQSIALPALMSQGDLWPDGDVRSPLSSEKPEAFP